MNPEDRWYRDILNQLKTFVDLELLALNQEQLENMQRLNQAEHYDQYGQLEQLHLRDQSHGVKILEKRLVKRVSTVKNVFCIGFTLRKRVSQCFC